MVTVRPWTPSPSSMGVPDADKPAFFQFTKAHFAELYAGDAVTSVDMLTSLRQLMVDDEQLAGYAQI